MEDHLTTKQKETLEFVINNLRILPPTFETMRKEFKVKGSQAIIDRLSILIKKGYLYSNYLPTLKTAMIERSVTLTNGQSQIKLLK